MPTGTENCSLRLITSLGWQPGFPLYLFSPLPVLRGRAWALAVRLRRPANPVSRCAAGCRFNPCQIAPVSVSVRWRSQAFLKRNTLR
jgi:hypothetical protein